MIPKRRNPLTPGFLALSILQAIPHPTPDFLALSLLQGTTYKTVSAE
jgi:hypothetical protein